MGSLRLCLVPHTLSAIALTALAAFALSHPATSLANGHCEYGEIAPQNPLSDDCWATPEDLGDFFIKFSVVPVVDFDGNQVCRQDNRVEFMGAWADGDFVRELHVRRSNGRTRLWADRHELVGIGSHTEYASIQEWDYVEAARVAPEVYKLAYNLPSKLFIEDGVDTDNLVASRLVHGWNSYHDSDHGFDWESALYACAGAHQEAKHLAEAIGTQRQHIIEDSPSRQLPDAAHAFTQGEFTSRLGIRMERGIEHCRGSKAYSIT